MRIVQLTPGTGSFYCGTCLRDNALTVELRRQGHDAIMVPLYLDPTLDEAPASPDAPIFYGGINVYLQQKSALFRKTPRWLDQLLDSPALLKGAAKKAGMTRADELGDVTLSMLRGEEGNQVKELDRLVEWLAGEVKPEVVVLSNVLLIGMARRIRERTGARLSCTLQGEDTFLDSLPEPYREESWRVTSERCTDVDVFLPVSRYYGDLMRERLRLPEAKVHVVHNGILLDGYGPAATPPDPPALGYLARMCPTKGLHALVDAYLLLRDRGRIPNLKLRVAGTKTPADEEYVKGLREKIAAAGLEGDATFLPNINRAEKIAFLQSLSALSVPATYGESFGLYVIESLAAGVPVVQPRHAAFPELIDATGGGVLCEPDDPASLADAVESLLLDPARARAMGEQGRRAVREKFSIETMARNTLQAFEQAPTVPRAPAAR